MQTTTRCPGKARPSCKLSLLCTTTLCLVLAIFTPISWADSVASQPSVAQQRYSKAQAHLKAGDQRAAVIELRNAVQADPGYVEARVLLGTLFLATGEPWSAKRELEVASTLDAPREQWIVPLGTTLLLMGEANDLLDTIDLLETDSDSLKADIEALRGKAFTALGKLDDAKASYDAALKLLPNHIAALLGQAQRALLARDTNEAQKFWDKAKSHGSNSMETWQMAGQIAFQRGDFRQAESFYKRAASIAPESAEPILSLAWAYVADNRLEMAKEMVIKAYKLTAPASIDHNTARYIDALIAVQENDYDLADELLSDILAADSPDIRARLLAATVAFNRKRWEQAIFHSKRVLNTDPSSQIARKIEAASELYVGDTASALNTLRSGPVAGAADPEFLARLINACGRSSLYKEGAETLRALAAQIPGNNQSLLDAANRLEEQNVTGALQAVTVAKLSDDGEEVVRLMSNSSHARALETALKLTETYPQVSYYWDLLGSVQVNIGQADDALTSFKKAIELKPDNTSALRNMAMLHLQRRQWDQAKAAFTSALDANANDIETMRALAHIASHEGDSTKAAEWLQKIRQVDKNDITSRKDLARYFVILNDAESLSAVAQEILSLKDDDADALQWMGNAEIVKGSTRSGLEYLNKAAEKLPNNAALRKRIVAAQLALGMDQEAEKSLEKLVQLSPDDLAAAWDLARLKLRKDDVKGAITIARSLQADLSPRIKAKGYELEGDIEALQGNSARAAQSYEAAFNTTPLDSTGLKTARALAGSGNLERYEPFLGRWADASKKSTRPLILLGDLQAHSGKLAKALDFYKIALERNEHDVLALNQAAAVSQLLQNMDDALSYAERAFELDPEDGQISDTLGWIHFHRNELGKAKPLLEMAARKLPGNPEVAYHYAVVLAQSGDRAEAKRQLDTALATEKDFADRKEAEKLRERL
ncbi:MAG: PEP-CTERM system TPR-repeat protein PrsT [Chromatiales bacterium]|nr:PEP-CTERM system TPR-repeat protein PrsT [Chromatiales bacterium]